MKKTQPGSGTEAQQKAALTAASNTNTQPAGAQPERIQIEVC